MNICIPVMDDHGLESAVCPHFGSAPLFLLVDTESGACRAVANQNMHHGHGQCMPLQSLQGEQVDGMVVGGIGRGALHKLMNAGIPVLISEQQTVAETLAAFQAGQLRAMTLDAACNHHGHGHGH